MKWLAILLAACGGGATATIDGPADSASGERTLDNCETSIDASVPAPYATWKQKHAKGWTRATSKMFLYLKRNEK